METKKNLFLLLLVVITITACTNKRNIAVENNTINNTENNTENNSPTWAATFMGNLPYANCEYIETWLTLNEDLRNCQYIKYS